MSRNGPLALIYHTLFILFVLAPILVVCVVAFTPEGYLSLPANGPSLRWFRAILAYPEFIDASSGTFTLRKGSPGIDAAALPAANIPPTDGRGIARPQGISPDVGAFELEAQK